MKKNPPSLNSALLKAMKPQPITNKRVNNFGDRLKEFTPPKTKRKK